jgi:hypothetical protein
MLAVGKSTNKSDNNSDIIHFANNRTLVGSQKSELENRSLLFGCQTMPIENSGTQEQQQLTLRNGYVWHSD